MPEVQETVTVIPGSALLWRITSRPAHSAQVGDEVWHFLLKYCSVITGKYLTV